MPTIDHINIRTAKLAESIEFYGWLLGLEPGPRPGFEFDGAWLYAGGKAIVHLSCKDRSTADADAGAGPVGHVALAVDDVGAIRRRLQRRGAAFSQHRLPDSGLVQIFVADPNGLQIELSGPSTGEQVPGE